MAEDGDWIDHAFSLIDYVGSAYGRTSIEPTPCQLVLDPYLEGTALLIDAITPDEATLYSGSAHEKHHVESWSCRPILETTVVTL